MIRSLLLAVALSVAAASVAQAQTPAPARASAALTIERPLTISAVSSMTFSTSVASSGATSSVAAGDTLVQVSGDPGRVYRITLPDALMVEANAGGDQGFAIISDNAGDITRTLISRTDANGTDRLRITGRLSQLSGMRLGDGSAALPIAVIYE